MPEGQGIEMRAKADCNEFVHKMGQASGFSESAFRQLTEETSEDVALQIMARFSRSVEESIEVIEAGLAQDSSERVWKACHKLAGTAELIGFKTFGDRARNLNHVLMAAPDIGSHTEDVRKFLEEARGLLASIRASFPTLNHYFL